MENKYQTILTLGRKSKTRFFKVPVGGIFEISGFPFLYVRTTRNGGYNASEYNDKHGLNVPLDATVGYYPNARENR